MTDITPYTQLKRMVAYALDELNMSEAEFDKAWLFAFRSITLMNFQVAGQTVTVRLPVLGNKTVPFPADLLSWSKIGILDEKGQINTLRINNALTTFRDNNPNRLEALASPNINDSVGNLAIIPFYSNYYYAGNVFQLYGLGNGVITYGSCKVDELNKVIILEPTFQYDSLMVEYISSPQKNSDYEFFTCMQEAVIAFIKWKFKQGSREEFYAAVTEGRRSLPKKKVELQTINQVIRESQSYKLRG